MEDHGALTSTVGIRPYRTEEEMKKTQACFHNLQGYGMYVHMRKSGGTSLRYLLSDIVKHNKSRLIYVTEGQSFNTSCKCPILSTH